MATTTTTASPCVFPNSEQPTNPVHFQCPNSSHCCPHASTCLTNGLCQDKANNYDGTLFNGWNVTGLYQSGSCVQGADDCKLWCTESVRGTNAMVWACNDDLTSYCCGGSNWHPGSQPGCGGMSNCSNPFSLPKPTKIVLFDSTQTILQSASTLVTTATATITQRPKKAGPSHAKLAGAIVGSIVGMLAVVLCLGIAVYFHKRRQKAENVVEQMAACGPQASLDQTAIEMNGAPKTSELDVGHGAVQELSGEDPSLSRHAPTSSH